MNLVVISGNLTRDPDMRQTASGMEILKLGVAVNDRAKNKDGEWEDVPNFFDVTVFGKRASTLSGRLAKGAKVHISGRLKWSQWEKGGEKRSKVEIIANDVEFDRKAEPAEQLFDSDIPF